MAPEGGCSQLVGECLPSGEKFRVCRGIFDGKLCYNTQKDTLYSVIYPPCPGTQPLPPRGAKLGATPAWKWSISVRFTLTLYGGTIMPNFLAFLLLGPTIFQGKPTQSCTYPLLRRNTSAIYSRKVSINR